MNAFTPSPEADSAPLPDAEVLYQQLCALLQPLRGPQTQLVGITSGGAWMARRLQHQWGLDHVGIISTALHRDDFAQRGLSRAEQTSLPFAVDGSHILLLDDVLHRHKTTTAQSRLDADARQRNLRDAFAVAPGAKLPAHVVLLDDVMTTGATLHAAARALRKAGVRRVDAWVCARVA